METKKTFSVVEFADDNSVEIVPTTWLEETNKGTICFWTFLNTRQLVRNKALPDKQKWRQLSLKKIWLQTDSYTKALQKCQLVAETSNIETEDTTHKKRAHKKPWRYQSETEISSEDESRVIKKKKVSKPVPPKYNQEKPSSPDLFSEASLPQFSLQNVSPPQQAVSNLLREPESSSDEATKNYRTKVLQKLQELCENQQDILAMQRKILAAVAVPGVGAEEEVLENGPCQTIEQIKQLDKSFDTPEKRTKMVNYLRSIGGSNPGAAVRKMLRKVATNEVLGAFSLRGKKSKLAFQDLRICSIIIGATQKNFKSLKSVEVEDLISLALKFAPHRN
ncbi:uncharacterized protein LOC127944516 [Carassius gibelio]|uniref:uncharacterized protein LOC127944516 n=1 Tax=Carassius gibelio TaxID=101364 RepID=UPI002278F8F8|nr:uncharacterized protein LOC127944516 [Carassius gibelio]